MGLTKYSTEHYWQLREKIRERLFSHLNPAQLEAVKTGKGPVLCLAGAGSGKTMAMVYRILHLYLFGAEYQRQVKPPFDLTDDDIELMEAWLQDAKEGRITGLPQRMVALFCRNGVEPRRILAITFTNKAAQEMKNRLEQLLGETMHGMWVMTFHAACLRILRREIAVLDYGKDFSIYDAADQLQVVRNIVKEMDLDEKKYSPRMFLSIISRFKCELKNTEKAAREAQGDYIMEKAATIYAEYCRRLKQNNAMDFDDLLMKTVLLFQNNPDILAKYQERFQYILVDEYQDTNHVQYILVKLLAARHQNLCVVGDDDQSIYAFRQADIRNILDFERDYPQTKVIKLEQNYRSTGCILAAANEVISCNKARKAKALWTEKGQGELLTIYEANDEHDEARFVCERINALLDNGENYRDCAVLMRTNAQSRVLEEWFMKRGLPYVIVGGHKFYERMEIKDIMAYLRVLANPQESVGLRRIINVPRRGIGEATLQRVEEYGEAKGMVLFEALWQYEEIGLSTRASKGIIGFLELMEGFREAVGKMTVTGLTEKILSETGYVESLRSEKGADSQSRLENLQEFLSVTKEYDEQAEEPTLQEFLGRTSLVTELDGYEDEANAVVMMTMHMAKGLEFPNVFIVGMEEGVFPHARSLLEEKELEEERRLCYVALTRAKERVFLVHARQRNLYGRMNHSGPSRFLEEIPEDLWKEYMVKDDFFKTTMSTSGRMGVNGGNSMLFSVGDKVEHKKWGQGVVVSAKGEGTDVELTIAFPSQGIKKLLTKYAPLKKI